MSSIEAEPKEPTNNASREMPWSPDRSAKAGAPAAIGRRAALLVTLGAVIVAVVMGWRMWGAYMLAPWTRDGTVRAYVVTVAPEVSGNIISLPVSDNQFVKKGDLLVQIDARNYKIAVQQADASLRQAQANLKSIDAQVDVQEAQITANEAQVNQAQAALTFAKQQAERYQELMERNAGTVQNAQQFDSQLRQQEAGLANAQATLKQAKLRIDSLNAQRTSAEANIAQATAQLDQAKLNLERTEIRSPANGWVTNLMAREGNFAAAERSVISVVDADSFWVDAYFEETSLADIRIDDPATLKLMGHREVLRGHVASVARAINVGNAQPNGQGVATVNPIFTWVRLAQRIPVRIHIDQIPPGIVLSAGMTATVQIDPRPIRSH
jgi:multidrug resistance efflux pump